MIQTGFESRVKIQQVIDAHLPEFISEENPKALEFFKQYYISQEYQGGPIDISDNLDQYLKLDNLTPEVVVDSTYITSGISTTDSTIYVNSTKGFPQSYGLLKIDNEIITYTGSTTDSFTGCVRGFSGITSYHQDLEYEDLVFSSSSQEEHESNSQVQNLSSLFLKEFYKKQKYTFSPGLENVDFVSSLNAGNFIKESKSLYQSKGTEESFRILFNVLFGETPKVINLENYLIKPSFANYVRRDVVIADLISGNPRKLVGQTIKKLNDDDTSAPVSEVEEFTRNNKTLYKLFLFVGYDDVPTIQGNFVVTSSTKSINNVSVGASVVTVDSTVGFPESGTIISGSNTITYTSKSLNQFFGCSGITDTITLGSDVRSDEIYYGYEDGDLSKKVEFKLNGVLSEFIKISDKLNLQPGEEIKVKSLGKVVKNPEQNKTYEQIFANSWIYNTSSKYEILDINNFELSSKIDRSSLKVGDLVQVIRQSDKIVVADNATVSSIVEADSRVILSNLSYISGHPDLSGNTKYELRRKINTAYSSTVPFEFGNSSVTSDVQNVYFDENNYAYVASNSLPSGRSGVTTDYSYIISKNIKQSQFSNTVGFVTDIDSDGNYSVIVFDADVEFRTGDRIFYEAEQTSLTGLESGKDYYVEVLSDPKRIKLYFSNSAIESGSNVKVSAPSDSGLHKFRLYSQRSEKIGSQKLLKKFSLENNIKSGKGEKTNPGSTGMLINGVEIHNYKSKDRIYYGPIDSATVISGGTGYDVINPPLVSVSVGSGTSCLVTPVLSGKVESVFVDSQDFDISKVVSIGITGGNGSGSVLEASLSKRKRDILFDGRPTTSSGGISTTTSQLIFNSNHNLSNGDAIIYNSNGNASIGIGTTQERLVNNGTYYAKIDNSTTIKIFRTKNDYSLGINTVGFSTYTSSGTHKFTTQSEKTTINEIVVIDGGSGYTNRKLIVNPSGISTVNDTVTFKNHGFSDGDLIQYNFETSSISGISTANRFYVLKLDDNTFRLCDAGVGGTNRTNYDRQKFVDFSSSGSGYQYFQYPDISAFIEYVGVGTNITETVVATPRVLGSIVDSYVYESGSGYGSTIFNYHKKPTVSIKNGKDGSLVPNIVNGQISSVTINYGGTEYYSIPKLEVVDPTGLGKGAKIRPVITNQKITDVKIVSVGIGYSTSSIIKVTSSGSNAKISCNVRSLTINDNLKYGNEVLNETDNNLQYSISGYNQKLQKAFKESSSKISRIIGWAYDGNPVYGPYGYSDPDDTNSSPIRLNSGYELNITNVEDRPVGFSSGFFIEDYQYKNSGHLDKNNGRFAKTPEFPNGVYAYYATIDSSNDPTFPYFIGQEYRSNTLLENLSLNQSYDINSSNLVRNTLPYKVSDPYAGNDFILESSNLDRQKVVVESVTPGSIDRYEIISPGEDYKVGDTLNFDNAETDGYGLSTKVSSIVGKDIVDLNTTLQTYSDALFVRESDTKVKVYVFPHHNLENNDYVTVSGFSTNLSDLNGQHKIGVTSFTSKLLRDIDSAPSVGFTTEIYLTSIPSFVSVGSSIGIGTEVMQVLNVFENLNILRIKRELAGVAHTSTSIVSFTPDSFTITKEIDFFDSKVNNKIYFNPQETIGLGTVTGITTTLSAIFGDSNISINVPTQGIYLKNHSFENNQRVILSKPSAATLITVSDTPSSPQFNLLDASNTETVYISNKGKNIVGLKTLVDGSELYFHTNGSDSDEYSLESDFDQITGFIKKVKTVVSVSTYHELTSGDRISLNVKPNLSVGIGTSSFINLQRNTVTDHIIVNPIGFNSTGVNTTTSSINISSHNLKTGDKIDYSANQIISGLSTGSFYIYKVDDDNIKLCETYKDSFKNPPVTVSMGDTGGSSQVISQINPQIPVIKNNDLVFDLSHSSLSGYQLKFFYDREFKNEFVSISTSTSFNVSGLGTVGISTNASLTLGYDVSLPDKLFYTLEKVSYISTSDTDVKNYSEIVFVDSEYKSDYIISNATGTSSTTFTINNLEIPEKLSYTQDECDALKYTTTSTSAKGPIDKIKIISGGSGYIKSPTFTGSNSAEGNNASIVLDSTKIGNPKELRVFNNDFEYSSDKTLSPKAAISPKIELIDSNTIGIITVTSGGSNYVSAPTVKIVSSETREVIDSGILTPIISGSSITNIAIEQSPKGIPNSGVELFTVNNTNGISIQQMESSSVGVFTCLITTPTLGFSTNLFSPGDEVFIEGVQQYSSDGSGFNSEDYGYVFLTVSSYDNSGTLDKVTINVSGLTTNTGIAKTIQDSSGTIINRTDYPSFTVSQNPSLFLVGEKIVIDGSEVDLVVSYSNSNILKLSGTYGLSLGEVLTGKNSGTIGTIDTITEYDGKFEIQFSSRKNIGWSDEIGKVSVDNQVSQDNDYYQNLSYSVKSSKTYEEIRNPVNSILHTIGTKNFADTEISQTTENVGITSFVDATSIVRSIDSDIRVETVYDFDLVKDVDLVGDTSKFISLNTRKLTPYSICKSNLVLQLDDISDKFSNFNREPDEFVYVKKLEDSDSYLSYLIQTKDIDGNQINIRDLLILNNGSDSFLLQRGSLSNVGSSLTTYASDEFGDFELITDVFDDVYLKFTPTNPYDIDYDLKSIQGEYISSTSGISTQSVGFIDLTSSVGVATGGVISGVTTTIIAVDSSKFASLHAETQVIDQSTNLMNLVEMYITHDGTDSYVSDYYVDSDSSSILSGTFIGSFGVDLSSGVLSLKYTNDTLNDVTIKTKVVGFGTTSIGIGTYRFKALDQSDTSERSAIYQSDFNSNVSAATTIFSINKSLFSSSRSFVEVGIGLTKSLHKILCVHDLTDVYTSQFGFISVGSASSIGIGTFGGSISGSNFELLFYPDAGVTDEFNVLSLSECIYTETDEINDYLDLDYGQRKESTTINQFNAINGDRINRTIFDLTYENTPVFAKTFNPSNTSILDVGTGVFSIDNHFFSNAEELIYTPKSTFVGVGSTPMKISPTDVLPTQVFAIKLNDNQFKLATSKSDALSGTAVTFVSLGEGNAHQLEMAKKNEKSIITLDNLVQYPLLFTNVNHALDGNGGQIGDSSSIFALSGISTIKPGDILRIDDEFMLIENVGFGTTNVGPVQGTGTVPLVQVERGFVGSSATSHLDTTGIGTIYRGSFNIVGSKIYFTESPRGNPQIIKTLGNLPYETSDFTGRVFLRSDYDSNQIYDDISDQFTGIGQTFTLTVGGANTSGIGTTGGTGIVFINSIFQTPTTENNIDNNFNIIESLSPSPGITSVVFTGITSEGSGGLFTSEIDVNQNGLPRGGIIVSLGSSGGLGYAPLVGASVTAVVSGGSITAVGVGTTDFVGSGYNGIVSIGVSVYEPGHSGAAATITATVGAGGTLTFNVTGGGTGYTSPQVFVSEPSYSNLEVTGVYRRGIGSTTDTGIGLLLDVEVGASSSTGIGSTYFEVTGFNISRQGYSFLPGDIFSPVGLVTDSRLSSPFNNFELTVLDTFTDSFAAWQFGDLDFIDSVKNYQDGERVRFPLFYKGSLLSFEVESGSIIDLDSVLLIFINGVLQEPGLAYQFDGGTSFTFTSPPKPEDNISVFFYRGTAGLDTLENTNIFPYLEKGDAVQILKNNGITTTVSQDERIIYDLSASDKFETNSYFGDGIDDVNSKPLKWVKKKTDRNINGELVFKTRDSIEPQIYPTARIIGDLSTSDTDIFVDDANFFVKEDSATDFSALVVNGISTTASNSIEKVSSIGVVQGFSGIITGISTSSGIGGHSLGIQFYLRPGKSPTPSNYNLAHLVVGTPICVHDTQIGSGVVSVDNVDSEIVGVGTEFLDNIYKVSAITSTGTLGIITCNIDSSTSVVGLTSTGSESDPIGKFSWGKLSSLTRGSSPISIGVTGNTIDAGLSTFPTIQRRDTGLRQTGSLPKS